MIKDFNPNVRVITKKSGASAEDIVSLQTRYPSLPDDAALLVAETTDLEINYRGRYLRLYGPSGCIEMNEAYGISSCIPNAVVLGDNGGSEAIVYLSMHGLCRIGYGALVEDELLYIADSLTDLLFDAVAAAEAVSGVEAE